MRTILNTISLLSTAAGGLSLFFLGHAWFAIGLAEPIAQVQQAYIGWLYPIAELLKPPATAFVALIGSSLPDWWRDVAVLVPATMTASFTTILAGHQRSERTVSPDGTKTSFSWEGEISVSLLISVSGISFWTVAIYVTNALLK